MDIEEFGEEFNFSGLSTFDGIDFDHPLSSLDAMVTNQATGSEVEGGGGGEVGGASYAEPLVAIQRPLSPMYSTHSATAAPIQIHKDVMMLEPIDTTLLVASAAAAANALQQQQRRPPPSSLLIESEENDDMIRDMHQLINSPFLRHQRPNFNWTPEVPSSEAAHATINVLGETLLASPNTAFGTLIQAVRGDQFNIILPQPYSLLSAECLKFTMDTFSTSKCVVLPKLEVQLEALQAPMAKLYDYVSTMSQLIGRKGLPLEPINSASTRRNAAPMSTAYLPIVEGEFLPLVMDTKYNMDANISEHSEPAWAMRDAVASVVCHYTKILCKDANISNQRLYQQVSPLLVAGHRASTGRTPNNKPEMVLNRWHASPSFGSSIAPETFGSTTPASNPFLQYSTTVQAYYVVSAVAGSFLRIVPKAEELMAEVIFANEREKELAAVKLRNTGDSSSSVRRATFARYEFSAATVDLIEKRNCALSVPLEAGMLILMHEAMPRRWTLVADQSAHTIVMPVSMFTIVPGFQEIANEVRKDEYESGQYMATSNILSAKQTSLQHAKNTDAAARLNFNMFDYAASWLFSRREVSFNAEYSSYLKQEKFCTTTSTTLSSHNLKNLSGRNMTAIQRIVGVYHSPVGYDEARSQFAVTHLSDMAYHTCSNCTAQYNHGVLLFNRKSATTHRVCMTCYTMALEEEEEEAADSTMF